MNEQSKKLQKILIGISENMECLYKDDVEKFLDAIEAILDDLDNSDAFGTEGWKRRFSLND